MDKDSQASVYIIMICMLYNMSESRDCMCGLSKPISGKTKGSSQCAIIKSLLVVINNYLIFFCIRNQVS